MKRILSLLIIVFSVSFTLAGCAMGLGSKELDLSKAYSVSYEGDNQEGRIRVSVNDGKLLEQMNLSKSAMQNFSLVAKIALFINSITIQAVPDNGLENGQEINLICEWDEEMAKDLKIKPVLKEFTHTIPEDAFRVLQPLTEEEVFSDVSILVEGVYPSIEAEVKYAFPNRITENIDLSIDDIDWVKRTITIHAEMDEDTADSLGVSLKPMSKEFEIPGYSTYHVAWREVPSKNKQTMANEGKKLIEKALDEIIKESSNKIFTYSSYSDEISKRAYKDVKLDNFTFAQVRTGANVSQYSASLGSLNRKMYNRLVLNYAVTIYDHVHTEGIVRYLPVIAHNTKILENGDLSYDLGEIEVYDKYIRDNPLDIKAAHIDGYADSYEIANYSAEDFLK